MEFYSPGEELRAEILDADGEKALPGCSLKDCIRANGDSVDAKMNWGNSDLSLLAGQDRPPSVLITQRQLVRLLGEIGRL